MPKVLLILKIFLIVLLVFNTFILVLLQTYNHEISQSTQLVYLFVEVVIVFALAMFRYVK